MKCRAEHGELVNGSAGASISHTREHSRHAPCALPMRAVENDTHIFRNERQRAERLSNVF